MENEHGTYLMAPVIRDPTAKSAGAWRPSLNMIRLIADLNGPGAELRVMEMLASQFDEFERDLITLSREMGVPIWPFKQPGVITPTDMMDMDRLPMKCWRPDCTGVHDNNRYRQLCTAGAGP